MGEDGMPVVLAASSQGGDALVNKKGIIKPGRTGKAAGLSRCPGGMATAALAAEGPRCETQPVTCNGQLTSYLHLGAQGVGGVGCTSMGLPLRCEWHLYSSCALGLPPS